MFACPVARMLTRRTFARALGPVRPGAVVLRRSTTGPRASPAAAAHAADLVAELDGAVELRNIMEKADSMRIRKILESDVRHTMPLDEYLRLCETNGIARQDAHALLRDLHRVGIVLYFHNTSNDRLRDVLFLKPEMVTDAMYAELGFTSPTQRFAEEQEARKQGELQALLEHFEPLRRLKGELDAGAASHVNRMTWLSFLALSGVIGTKWYLSYIYFSWDIMEPVTYFSGATMGTLAFWWWISTNTDYQYRNVYEYFLARRQAKQYRRAGFDPSQYAEMEGRVEQVRRELETLQMTDYSPRLISAYLERKGVVALPANPSNPSSPAGRRAEL